MRYTFKLKKVVLPALLLAIAVVGMQLSSCNKKKDSPASTQVSLSAAIFKDTTLLTKATPQTYVATNLPQGVTVTYTGNAQQAPGDYTVTATFSLNSGFTWAASEQPDASGKVVKTAKLSIADYLTSPKLDDAGAAAVAIIKAADIYANVTIPATLFGVPVVSIDSAAFANNTTITSVKVSEGVTYVGKAFWGCTNLTTVDLPKTLKFIENEAFIKAPAVGEKLAVKLPTSLTKIIIRAENPPVINNWWHYGLVGAEDKFYITLLGTADWVATEIGATPVSTVPNVSVYVPTTPIQTIYRSAWVAEGTPWGQGWNAVYWDNIKIFTDGGIS
ncbi:MAG: leucine-rich repeat domain-containing protein [Anaerovoracaceae bacterium]